MTLNLILMKYISLILFLASNLISSQTNHQTPYEKGNGNQTATYEEMVKYYDDLSKDFPTITVRSIGNDDNGEPIRVVIYNASVDKNNPTILINNGIHPGEPD